MNAPTTSRVGGNQTGRNALTETQLSLVLIAAHKALSAGACDAEVSPSKVAKLVRRFSKTLHHSRLTFHEFLTHQANHPDPLMRRIIAYLDPTGERAVNNVMRGQR